MPPTPIGAEMTYGPSRVPEEIIDAKLPTPRWEQAEPELLWKLGELYPDGRHAGLCSALVEYLNPITRTANGHTQGNPVRPRLAVARGTWACPTCRAGADLRTCRLGSPEIERSDSTPRVRSARSVSEESAWPVHAALASVGIGHYARR